MIESVHRINDRIRIIRMVDFNDPQRIPITTGEHRAVLDAIAARDAERAGDLHYAHVEQSILTVRELVSRALERIYLS
jgi:DNA-binding GntR family transcriptional regulator